MCKHSPDFQWQRNLNIKEICLKFKKMLFFSFFFKAEFAAYELGKVLGAGGFGLVMSATRKKDNLPVSVIKIQ